MDQRSHSLFFKNVNLDIDLAQSLNQLDSECLNEIDRFSQMSFTPFSHFQMYEQDLTDYSNIDGDEWPLKISCLEGCTHGREKLQDNQEMNENYSFDLVESFLVGSKFNIRDPEINKENSFSSLSNINAAVKGAPQTTLNTANVAKEFQQSAGPD